MRSGSSHRRVSDDGVLVPQRCACIRPWSRIDTSEPALWCRLIPNSCLPPLPPKLTFRRKSASGCRPFVDLGAWRSRKHPLARCLRRCHHLRGGGIMGEAATREGHQIFTNELTRFAERAGDSRITALIGEVRGPLRVAVHGRDGVGRDTVAAALGGAGVTVANGAAAADVDVVVVAEALKPEDRSMLDSGPLCSSRPRRPTVVVLNKADLAGFGAGGPIAVANRRAVDIHALTGVSTVPM